MKHLSFLGLSLVLIISAVASDIVYAQTVNDIGKVVLGVRIPSDANEDTQTMGSYLQNKLIGIISSAGCSSFDQSNFYAAPSIIINTVDQVEGGMKIIYKINGDLYISIRDGSSKVVFDNASFPISGTGMSKEAALKNALQKIDFKTMGPCFQNSKDKILKYYASKQEELFAKADSYAQRKEFDAAIACLMMIPEELSELNKKAYDKACIIYKQQEQALKKEQASQISVNNSQCLSQARAELASHNAYRALQTLRSYVLNNSNDDNEYHSLLKQAESMVSKTEEAAIEKEKTEYADRRKEYEDRVNLANREMDIQEKRVIAEADSQKQLNETLKEIALSYIKKGKKLF